MKCLNYSVFIIIIVLCFSCKKDINDTKISSSNYLIIGNTGGFIAPNTQIPYYLMKNNFLLEDTSVRIGNIPINVNLFNFNVLQPDTSYQKVKNLTSHIPSSLLAKNDSVIGLIVPDLGLWDIRTSINGTNYRWLFSNNLSNCDTDIQNFIKTAKSIYKFP